MIKAMQKIEQLRFRNTGEVFVILNRVVKVRFIGKVTPEHSLRTVRESGMQISGEKVF